VAWPKNRDGRSRASASGGDPDRTNGSGNAAIVHDYLNQSGGAERVALHLARMWEGAPIYTSLYRPDFTFPEFREHEIRTSLLDRLPINRGFRNLFPLYPAAFRALGTLGHDVVISSSSAWAHEVRTAPDTTHVVYCHTPARWLYGRSYLGASARQQLARPLFSAMRRIDRNAARRADRYVANSENVRRRIRDSYGLDADVVYPPVDVDRFTPRPRGERLLVVSRLLPYKRVHLAIEAANRAGMPLDVVGSGPNFFELRDLAGPTVEFHRRLSDEVITEMMESCRALLLPGDEDFGITPVEALAAGKPVVAFGAGGALETLDDGVTAALFREPTVESLLEAIRRIEALDTSPEDIAATARRFSPEAFRTGIHAAVERARHGDPQVAVAREDSAASDTRAERPVS
jgi:glycosyltransferase involved in cell wall biosynthesis